MEDRKRRLSITTGLLIFFLICSTLVIAYNYFGKTGTVSEGKFSILFCSIYIETGNKTVLSILLANTGTVDLTVKSMKIGEEVVQLPAKGMQGENKIVAGTRSSMEIPLKGTYEIGKAYDISIETDPPATYIPIQITAVFREW